VGLGCLERNFATTMVTTSDLGYGDDTRTLFGRHSMRTSPWNYSNWRWSVSGTLGGRDSGAIGADHTATVKQASATVINDRIMRKRMTKLFSLRLELCWGRMDSHANIQNHREIQVLCKLYVVSALGCGKPILGPTYRQIEHEEISPLSLYFAAPEFKLPDKT
jgi:hypothetical protein